MRKDNAWFESLYSISALFLLVGLGLIAAAVIHWEPYAGVGGVLVILAVLLAEVRKVAKRRPR